MNDIKYKAALQKKLEGKPRLWLTLRDRDYGAPCPNDRWQVQASVNELLLPLGLGMVIDLDVLETEDGDADDVLEIGVFDVKMVLPKLRELLKQINIAAGASLTLDGGQFNLLPDLLTRAELFQLKSEQLITKLIEESRLCAPSDWQAGTLTIQFDGNWLGYKLKNPQSDNKATISSELKHICEEFAMLMWINGKQWREAALSFEGENFTINFNYDEQSDPIPRNTEPPTASGGEKFTIKLGSEKPLDTHLYREKSEILIRKLIDECKQSSPSDSQSGELTIQFDGDWLAYELVNNDSDLKATISANLLSLSEELVAFSWENGKQWRKATLFYEGENFSIKFSFGEPSDSKPRDKIIPSPTKPWWKFW